MKKTIVFSLGGSVIMPEEVDFNFLKEFKALIQKITRKDRVVIVTGGGKTARDYIKALRKANASIGQQDLIGIEATRLNARLLIFFFKLNQDVPLSINEVVRLSKKQSIVISGGMIKGTTTDGVASLIAVKLKACCIINITKVKGLYDKDPLKNKDAKLIRKASYNMVRKMLNKIKEQPGQHFIIDKLALKIASKNKIRIIILGKNIKNIENYLNHKNPQGFLGDRKQNFSCFLYYKRFEGTIIK